MVVGIRKEHQNNVVVMLLQKQAAMRSADRHRTRKPSPGLKDAVGLANPSLNLQEDSLRKASTSEGSIQCWAKLFATQTAVSSSFAEALELASPLGLAKVRRRFDPSNPVSADFLLHCWGGS